MRAVQSAVHVGSHTRSMRMTSLLGVSDASARPLRVGEVFVPGGLPTITYNPRDELGLEQKVHDYLDEGHRILSVSGPTKSGKTVLLRSIVPDAVWVSGGSVTAAADLWHAVADRLQVFTDLGETEGQEESTGRSSSGEGGIGVVKGSRTASEDFATSRSSSLGRSRPISHAAIGALVTSQLPLVIDDFHYISQSIQLEIVRALKDPVFDGLPVVLVSVPHRAYDAVRVEKEMTGRVEQLMIEFWNESELAGIARAGFEAMNVVDPAGALGLRLAAESFSSPHLMQEFCLQLVKGHDVRVRPETPVVLEVPDWAPFFRLRASAASKSAFDLLARGPRQRTDRMERRLKDGRVTDIYGAILAAIAHTGPLTQLTYEELRGSLREVMASEAPQRHEITRVLEEMTKIAREKIEGEPVVDYDEELSTLHISDPFFAYFLRWGTAKETA